MDDEQKQQETTDQPVAPSPLKNMLIYAVIAIAAGGAGFSVPLLFPALVGGGVKSPDESTPPSAAFIEFGESVVNLNEDRLNRYLRVKITLKINTVDEEAVLALVEKNKAVLRSWLLSYLSDQRMDDIRGAAGQNRLRREIQDQFNTYMFPDGYDKIQDVLFEEFGIQ